MVTRSFSKEFAVTAHAAVSDWKKNNTDPADALRALEKLCAASGEEFHPDGTALVESIYDGKFDGGQASNFVPNPKPATSTATPPVAAGEVSSTPKPVVDAQAVRTTPDPRFHPPADIAHRAATSTATPPEPTSK